jgi:hypothetical protein
MVPGREDFSSARGRGGGRCQWFDEDTEEMETSVGEEENLEKSLTNNKDTSCGGGAKDMQVVLADPNTSISPLKEQEKKRPRRDGEGEEVQKIQT